MGIDGGPCKEGGQQKLLALPAQGVPPVGDGKVHQLQKLHSKSAVPTFWNSVHNAEGGAAANPTLLFWRHRHSSPHPDHPLPRSTAAHQLTDSRSCINRVFALMAATTGFEVATLAMACTSLNCGT